MLRSLVIPESNELTDHAQSNYGLYMYALDEYLFLEMSDGNIRPHPLLSELCVYYLLVFLCFVIYLFFSAVHSVHSSKDS